MNKQEVLDLIEEMADSLVDKGLISDDMRYRIRTELETVLDLPHNAMQLPSLNENDIRGMFARMFELLDTK